MDEEHKHEFEVIQLLMGTSPATKKPASVITRRCVKCGYTYDDFNFDGNKKCGGEKG